MFDSEKEMTILGDLYARAQRAFFRESARQAAMLEAAAKELQEKNMTIGELRRERAELRSRFSSNSSSSVRGSHSWSSGTLVRRWTAAAAGDSPAWPSATASWGEGGASSSRRGTSLGVSWSMWTVYTQGQGGSGFAAARFALIPPLYHLRLFTRYPRCWGSSSLSVLVL